MIPRAHLISVSALVGSLVLAAVLVAGPASLPSSARSGPSALSPSVTPAALPPDSWPTYMYDIARTGANHNETRIGPSSVGHLAQLWQVQTEGSDFSAPILVNGTVYYGSWDGWESAVNATDGSVLWATFLGTDPSCNGGYSPMGITSTPAYHGGTLYLGGGDDYWYALNASTGAVDWKLFTGSQSAGYFNWASALVHRGSLYIGTSSCFDDPLVPASLLKVNLTSHSIVARFNTSPVNNTGESIWTTPALDARNNTVWVTTGNEQPPGYPLYANSVIGLNASTLNVSGSWQVPNVAGEDSDFGSTPTLFHTSTGVPMIVATNKNGVAYALDRANVSRDGSWKPVWNLTTGGGFSGGAFDGSTLYLAGGSTVYAVDPDNGSVLWTAPMVGGGEIIGSLSWANGLVYAGGGGVVEAIDAANGTVLWSSNLVDGQQTVTEPVVVGDRLFVTSGDYASQGFLTAYGLTFSSYSVHFVSSGLPVGKRWSASVDGATLSSRTAELSFLEPNGSFRYLIRGPGGYQVSAPSPSGSLAVAGENLTVPVTFERGPTSTVSFAESGLPKRSSWCVKLAGWSACSVGTRLSLGNLTPGEYAYDIVPDPGYDISATAHRSPIAASGTLDASGAVVVRVHFALVTYTLAFTESGLAPGTRWTVRLRGVVRGHETTFHRSSRGTEIDFSVPNGTYNYTVSPVRGYSGGGTGTTEIVAGGASVAVKFTAESPSGTSAGLPGAPLERTVDRSP